MAFTIIRLLAIKLKQRNSLGKEQLNSLLRVCATDARSMETSVRADRLKSAARTTLSIKCKKETTANAKEKSSLHAYYAIQASPYFISDKTFPTPNLATVYRPFC